MSAKKDRLHAMMAASGGTVTYALAARRAALAGDSDGAATAAAAALACDRATAILFAGLHGRALDEGIVDSQRSRWAVSLAARFGTLAVA